MIPDADLDDQYDVDGDDTDGEKGGDEREYHTRTETTEQMVLRSGCNGYNGLKGARPGGIGGDRG